MGVGQVGVDQTIEGQVEIEDLEQRQWDPQCDQNYTFLHILIIDFCALGAEYLFCNFCLPKFYPNHHEPVPQFPLNQSMKAHD